MPRTKKTAAASTKAAPPTAPTTTAPRRRRPAPWKPRPIPIHPLEGRPEDPRLAAALAARERWLGRSGRPALKSATQAVAFARERHLVHPVAHTALPNLIDPLVGRSCTEEERTSGTLAETLESWYPEIIGSPELVEARLCFDQPTLISADLWPSLAVVAAASERSDAPLTLEADEVMEILDRRGTVATDRLARLLDLSGEEFAVVQGELESRLLVLSRPDVDEDDEAVTVLEPIAHWRERSLTQRSLELSLERAWTFLFIAALRAAVVLWPEEVEALYPWTEQQRADAIGEAMGTGAVVTYPQDETLAYVASPVPR